MKLYFFLCCILIFILPSCSLREREKEIEAKLSEVNQKEQELLLKEKTLQLKEQELISRELALDSSRKIISGRDSAFIYNPAIVGTWSVVMNCTETTCSGSAVGDTKTEQWEIAYQGDAVIAKAMVGKDLVRVYTGKYFGNTLQLTAEQQETTPSKITRMLVRLQQINKGEMEGRREILRPEDCRIIYSLVLKKT